MFMFDHLICHWTRLGLPIMELFNWNHTIFSEGSGEIALSVLSHSQPETKRSDLKNTQDYWLLTRDRYLAVRQGQDLPRHKKHRVAGTCLPITIPDIVLLQDKIRLYLFLTWRNQVWQD